MHPRRGQQPLILEAKRLLETPATARLPVREIARRLGCSIFHLCRVFRRSEGKTMSAYRAELRLDTALRRLREAPETDLTELALDCGYCSHSHFTSSFRRWLGTTPSAFAAGVLNDRARGQPSLSTLSRPGPSFCADRRERPLSSSCSRWAE